MAVVGKRFGLGEGAFLEIGGALTPGLIAVGSPSAVGAGGQVLRVGIGETYSTLASAIGASHDGDLILVNAGTYTNDFAYVTHKITIEGVGGMVNMVATIAPPNNKGILVVNNDVTIKNLSFSGVAIADSLGGNGAGIRYEGGQMVLSNTAFIGNQNGIMGNPVIAGLTNTITIDHSVFSGNGSGTGLTHNLYIGAVDSLTVTNSIFQNSVIGHEFKSRAHVNNIENNIFSDGPTGTASYSIDLPNGGVAVIKNNLIERGPMAQQINMIHFGGEGIPYAGSSLTVTGNSFVNDRTSATVGVLNHTTISVNITGNKFTGIATAQLVKGPATVTSNTDGSGVALPDSTLVGVLPGSTLILTDALPHTVMLDYKTQAVQGGAGRLTAIAVGGHVIAIGGSGGMDFVEARNSGGNQITTLAGSVNSIRISGQDSIDSRGTDTIIGGVGNITGQISGSAVVDDGFNDDKWTVLGTAVFKGHGGRPAINVGAKGNVTITGPLGYLEVQNNGGFAQFDIIQGGAREAMSISGGGVIAKVYSGQTTVSTAAGAQGSTLRLGAGKVLLTSLGSDVIHAGSANATIIVSGKATVYAGTGSLALFGRGNSGATFYGNGGNYVIDGDTGGITYYGGALDSTIEVRLSNLTLIGGTGRLSVNGGSRETMIGGSGGLNYTATDGGGANSITTAAGSQNVLTLGGANIVHSWGQDLISGGTGNQLITVQGNAVINGGTGASKITVSGAATLYGVGYDQVSVTAGANATIYSGSLTCVQQYGATVRFTVLTGANAASVTVTGGSAVISGGATAALSVVTGKGISTSVVLGDGPASVMAYGNDMIQAGSGSDTITITAANTQIWGGSGALTVKNYDWTAGDAQTVNGGSGALTYSQSTGALSFIGGSGSAVVTGGSGSLYLTGGSGNLTASGGGAATNFNAGSGTTNLTMNAAGGRVLFGTGDTNVQVAGWGKGVLFDFVAGSGGGADLIKGFRVGTDKLVLVGGVGVQSQAVVGGSANLLLTDGTRVQLVGVTSTTQLFG